MVQIFLVAYLVIGLLATLLIWTVLVAAKRKAEKSLESEASGNDRFFESKPASINFYSS
jgi:hypothetical protein